MLLVQGPRDRSRRTTVLEHLLKDLFLCVSASQHFLLACSAFSLAVISQRRCSPHHTGHDFYVQEAVEPSISCQGIIQSHMHFIFLHSPTEFLQPWHCDIVSDETQLLPLCSVCDLMSHTFHCHPDHSLD